jgi:hypothetical protein
VTVAQHEDVLRLQVAMDQPSVVRGRKPAGELDADVDRFPDRQGCVQGGAQRLPSSNSITTQSRPSWRPNS